MDPDSISSEMSMPRPAVRRSIVSRLSSKVKTAARSPRLAAALAYWIASVDLPTPGGAEQEHARPQVEAPPDEGVELGDPALEQPACLPLQRAPRRRAGGRRRAPRAR